MKGYLEYLELYAYFARTGERKLSREDYALVDAEWKVLTERHAQLSKVEKARLSEVKAILYRDKP